MFRRVAVLLDSLAPSRGAFAHGLLWAQRSHAPLCGVSGIDGEPLLATDTPGERELACAATCARYGVAWEANACVPVEQELSKMVGPSELLVFGPSLSPVRMRWLCSDPEIKSAVLVCPSEAAFVSRVLVLDAPGQGDAPYLRLAAQICQSIRAGMVVLSLGASQRQVEQRRRQAQAALLPSEAMVDFDVVVGPNTNTALANVARWRHCQMVITRRQRRSFWRRWLGREAASGWLDPAVSLLHLILPASLPQSSDSDRTQENGNREELAQSPTPLPGGLRPPRAGAEQEVAS
jgi:nucleotide-binding universal stress UspA family protein